MEAFRTIKITALDIGGSGIKVAKFISTQGTHDISLCGNVKKYELPSQNDFGEWVRDIGVANDSDFLAISCAGFIDSRAGTVKLFRAANWINYPLLEDLQRFLPKHTKMTLYNDAEAHLLAQFDELKHPIMSISMGTSLGFAISTESGDILRPRNNMNFDLGSVKIPTRADNNEVWWALGSKGLKELENSFGFEEAYKRFGCRMGAFLTSLCSIFQPETIVFSGGIITKNENIFLKNMKEEFLYQKPNWLNEPKIIISKYTADAALWGVARNVETCESRR